jgi:hypothetical protein
MGSVVVPDQISRGCDVYAEAIVPGSATIAVMVLKQPISLAFRFVDVLGLHGRAQPEIGSKTTVNNLACFDFTIFPITHHHDASIQIQAETGRKYLSQPFTAQSIARLKRT